MDNQLEIKTKVLSGEMSGVDALAVLKKSTKPWHTKEWKVNRLKKLGTTCQECGSNKPPLVLQHKWHPPPLREIIWKIRNEYNLTGYEPYDKYREEVIARKAAVRSIEYHQRYISLLDEDVKTLCKRCAFIEDMPIIESKT
jgi:hypothetical protein